jgi:hypothetical protein
LRIAAAGKQQVEFDWTDCLVFRDTECTMMQASGFELRVTVMFACESVILEFTARTVAPGRGDFVDGIAAATDRGATGSISKG